MKEAPYTMLVVGLTAVVVMLGVVGIAGGTSVSCAVCHAEQTDWWSASEHADTNCHICHQRPGAIGAIEQRARMLAMVRSTVLPRRSERASVPNAHCLTCHPAVAIGVIESSGVRVRHADIIESGRRCTQCHNTVAHGASVALARGPAMDDCMKCHHADSVRGGCEVCHIASAKRERSQIRTTWQITHGVTWRYTHGLGDRSTCSTCHPLGYCVRCHGVDLPHPSAWNNTHGAGARSAPRSCEQCHEHDLCSGCHTTDMPHADGFLREHPEDARGEGRAGCLDCHLEASCDACHTAHIHPGLSPRQIETLRTGMGR